MDNQPPLSNQLKSTADNPSPRVTNSTRSHPRPRQSLTLNPFSIILILSIIAFIVFAVITYYNDKKFPEIKIDNFSKLYPKIPDETKKTIQAMLYNIVNSNNISNQKIPKSGATIRAGSNTTNYNQTNNFYTDTFLVDLESLQQSYYVRINWSPSQDNNVIDDTYPIVILCPTQDQLIYPEFECVDGFDNTTEANLFSILPIEVAYYEGNYAYYVHYLITLKSETDNPDDYIIEINDYTGGNYEDAMKKLRETNIDLEKYKVEYKNLVNDKPGRAPGGE